MSICLIKQLALRFVDTKKKRRNEEFRNIPDNIPFLEFNLITGNIRDIVD